MKIVGTTLRRVLNYFQDKQFTFLRRKTEIRTLLFYGEDRIDHVK
jgi:hypothetical protein